MKHVAKRKSVGGRRTRYQAGFAEQAHRLALLGLTDAEMAPIFGVGETCFKHWKIRHADFAAGLARGKAQADAEVAHSLYQRAVGYKHDAVKIFGDVESGNSLVVPYVEHYPPDTAAALAWLRNRQPEKWRADPQAVAVANATASASTVVGVAEDVMEAIRTRLKVEG